MFAATRAYLAASGLPKKYWSVECPAAIDKETFMPIKRLNGRWLAPNAEIPGEKMNASFLLPFGREGYVLYNTPKKQTLADRALKERYLRATS